MAKETKQSGGDREGTEYTRINLCGVDRDTPIYRIMPLSRLCQLFEKSENVLPQPSKWDDPFENFILKSPVQISSGEIGSFGFHDDVYGQCWTLHRASDAMWRIYSPDKDAVRVRTTIEKLARSLSSPLGSWAHAQSFIGKVEYLFKPDLENFAATIFEDELSPATIARSLLVKRRAFLHEREVRLIYCEREPVKHTDGLYRYAVDRANHGRSQNSKARSGQIKSGNLRPYWLSGRSETFPSLCTPEEVPYKGTLMIPPAMVGGTDGCGEI